MATHSSAADDRIIEITDRTRGAPQRVLSALLIACVAAAIFGSNPLLDAARALPEGATAARLQQAAARWDGAMAGLGATVPYTGLRAGIRFLEAWKAPS